MINIKVWKEGEKKVADYLKEKGYKVIYTNFSCGIAELDIVAILSKKVQKTQIKNEFKEKCKGLSQKSEIKLMKFAFKNELKKLIDLLVIVEVKTRTTKKYGSGLDAISIDKIMHMKRGTEVLLKMKQFKNMQPRFDIASVDNGKITYIENAF